MDNQTKNVKNVQPIKVYCRLKPRIKKDESIKYSIKKNSSDSELLLIKFPDNQLLKNKKSNFKFQYNGIFDENSSQKAVYEHVASPIVDKFTRGFNGTIFTYGQTGSGKTYTINGSSMDGGKGIIHRSFQHVFDVMTSKSKEDLITYDVSFSYIEIYDEVVYDLLKPKSDDRVVKHVNKKKNGPNNLENLKNTVSIHIDKKGHVVFKNLTIHTVKNVSETMKLLKKGDTRKKISPTSMNVQSSRSHCICTIYLTQQNDNSSKIYTSKLNLVDLAGSERTLNSNVEEKTFSEARHINLSLHYLQQVITSLSNSSNKKYVPYRNSIMTSVLRDSLGGNCVTAMIANLALNRQCILESISTCRFAQRIGTIKNNVTENWNVSNTKEILLQRKEIESLKIIIKEQKCQSCSKQTVANRSSAQQDGKRPLRLNYECGDGDFATGGNTEPNTVYGDEVDCEPRGDGRDSSADFAIVADTDATPLQPLCGCHVHVIPCSLNSSADADPNNEWFHYVSWSSAKTTEAAPQTCNNVQRL